MSQRPDFEKQILACTSYTEIRGLFCRWFGLSPEENGRASIFAQLSAGDFDSLGYRAFFARVVEAFKEVGGVSQLKEPVYRYLQLHENEFVRQE